MKIHKNKQWNRILFIMATAVFIAMIFYSNSLIKNIREEERRKVMNWADAITHRANVVSFMDQFFETIRVAESKRASHLAKAMKKINDVPLDATFDEDMLFYLEIMESNSTIPSILSDEKGTINNRVNVESDILNMKNINELGERKAEFDSLIIPYYKKEYFIIYYKESKIYSDLRIVIDKLIKSYFQEIVINNASVPVIVTDSTMSDIINHGLIDSIYLKNKEDKRELIKYFQTKNKPIKIEIPYQGTCYVLYDESSVLKQLRYYPIIQLTIIIIFIIAGYLILSFARRSEQNRVWVGMSKETAHQLGTPISSLLAWNELLKEQEVDSAIMKEIEKDVHRLETIAQRFSKIGSEPELVVENLATVIEEFVEYLQTRISSKVVIKINRNNVTDFQIPVNKYLFEWVIENLCKNSVDAMNGNGVIIIDLLEDEKNFYIDVSDTGKGISSKESNLIFKPGYSTKKRGWGLGLPLAKRIIKQYHKGKLFVKSSVSGRGMVMRIQFRK
jgi:uncharacterized protein involved in tolerance to divalent cations